MLRMQSFCDTHTLAFLKNWNRSMPLDLSLSNYFKAHKSLGSHDRRKIGEMVYSMVRWQSVFEEYPDLVRLKMLKERPAEEWAKDPALPIHARVGLSSFLYQELKKAYGEKAEEIALTFNQTAPVSIRTNLLKISREDLIAKLQTKFPVRASTIANAGIVLEKREPLFALPEFKEGLFEMQDEASQLVADLIDAKPSDRVLDYCSGSGGKTLAIAPKMKGKGELYLHDIREKALQEAKLRLRRAGVQNAQILAPGHQTLKKLFGKMDFVLVDVPCSGTGTLRRNPDMKWKIDRAMIERLVLEQRTIFAEALKFAKSTIVYATCSILPDENEKQVDHFLKTHSLQLEKTLKTLPERNGPDGFFAAVFKKVEI